jgi:phosphohistidine phosphatase SixA
MILLLIRHGNAARQTIDHSLHLTSRGQKEVFQTAQAIQAKKIILESIWHSPKPRTVETARILLEKIGLTQDRLEEKKELAPDGDAQKIYDNLMEEKPVCAALVTHLPFLEKFAPLILEDMKEIPELEFPTAGVQAFEWQKEWKWLWSFDPSKLI